MVWYTCWPFWCDFLFMRGHCHALMGCFPMRDMGVNAHLGIDGFLGQPVCFIIVVHARA